MRESLTSWQFYAEDPLSSRLLATIPKKVVNWIRELEARYDVTLITGDPEGQLEFERGRISMLLNVETSTLAFGDHQDENKLQRQEYVQLWWDGHWEWPTNIRVSDLSLVEASVHLDDFILVEKRFYDALTELQKELEASAPTPKMPNKYDRDSTRTE